MPFGRSSTVVSAAAAALLLAACSSDNTGPKLSPAAQAASHYDSLGHALLNSSSEGDSVRGEMAEAIAGVAANGVAPTPVTVTVNGSQATWLSAFANLVDSASNDSIQVVAFWSDPALDTYVWMFLVNGSPEIGAGTVGDGDASIPMLSGPNLTFSASGTCHGGSTIPYPDSVLIFIPLPTYAPSLSTCMDGTSLESFTYTFSGDTTATAQLTSFVAQGVTVNGARLQFLSGAPFESHTVPAPVGSAAARLRSSPYRLH